MTTESDSRHVNRESFYRRERHSIPAARAFAAAALGDWGIEGERADDITLCVSELVTNALLHGVPPGRGFRLYVDHGGDTIRVAVHDSGSGRPRLDLDEREDGESGRGLLLVAALADKWGVEEQAPGKTVWCEFVLAPPPLLASAVLLAVEPDRGERRDEAGPEQHLRHGPFGPRDLRDEQCAEHGPRGLSEDDARPLAAPDEGADVDADARPQPPVPEQGAHRPQRGHRDEEPEALAERDGQLARGLALGDEEVEAGGRDDGEAEQGEPADAAQHAVRRVVEAVPHGTGVRGGGQRVGVQRGGLAGLDAGRGGGLSGLAGQGVWVVRVEAEDRVVQLVGARAVAGQVGDLPGHFVRVDLFGTEAERLHGDVARLVEGALHLCGGDLAAARLPDADEADAPDDVGEEGVRVPVVRSETYRLPQYALRLLPTRAADAAQGVGAHDETADVLGVQRERPVRRRQGLRVLVGTHEAEGEFGPGPDVVRGLDEALPEQGLGLVVPLELDESVGPLDGGVHSAGAHSSTASASS
nr:ATP-binding protein [Streptomyces venezuelae]